jgi:hypothetical protein
MPMSTAKPIMDAEDMRDADWQIVDELRSGRANAPLLAERTGYSAQYIRERLGRLKQDDIVLPLGHGIYELNENEVPRQESDPDEHD